MEAVRAFLQTYDTDYNLMTISNQTLAKLLAGKFKTFEELNKFNIQKDLSETSSLILYLEILNQNRSEYIYIIETIFINE
ncbi:hypothetical protein [Tenacibaculum maritimum]|uniref:hypothetical protein n=2 Tax=Tenacibaculum maritimum TaxID=107401 RepID=UPI00387674FF